MRLAIGIAAAALATSALAQGETTLKIGDKAPDIKVARWLKGTPTTKFEPGKVYVVEFWATWCGPCKVSIPHLTELAKKYAGKVSFNGISIWEDPEATDESYIETVAKFVTEWGDKMDYNVAADGLAGTMAKTWMAAAGQRGIPSAFIVNGEGVIAWIGHPMDGFDEALAKVVEGKFDIAAAKAEAEKQAKEEAEMEALIEPLQNALMSGDYPLVLKEVDSILVKRPDLEPMLDPLRFEMLYELGKEDELYASAKKAFEGYAKENAMALNQMAWTIVDDAGKKLKKPDYDLCIKMADKAVALTKGEDAAILDTAAFAYFKKGNVKKAVELQEKAVAILDKADYPDEMKADIKARLAEFKKKLG